MPLKLEILSEKAAQWEGWCRHRLFAFNAIRQPGSIIKQTYSLPQGIMAYVMASDIVDIIRIWGGAVAGFICHPRSDSFPGGVTPQGASISPAYPYPLVDNDHGSFILTPPTPWAVSRDAENYGNIDWQGSNGTILSWRGPSSRHFPLDPSINYPGYTLFDRTVGTPPFDTDYFTPFGPNVYQSGNILATLPNSKILGAALVNGVLTVVASLFNGSYSDEVWQLKNGWQKLWAQGGSSPLVCWFFTADGMKAYRGNETLDFTSGGPVYTQITDPGGSATLSIHYNDKYDLEKKGSWHPYREDVSLSISLKSSDNSIVNNQGAETFANVPVYVLSNTGPAPLAIFGPVNFVNPSDYSATGGEGDYTFTFPSGNSCGTQSVTVTDRCGKTASMDVRMSSGKFVLVSSIPCTTYFSDGGGTIPVTCSGVNSGVRTLNVGAQQIVESYLLTQNPVYQDLNGGYCPPCEQDGGALGCSSSYTPLTLPPLVYTCTLCGPPVILTVNYYMVVCNVATYNWVCP